MFDFSSIKENSNTYIGYITNIRS